MMLLLVAGIAFLLIGLMAIVFGIPVKEFSFGNTMIVSGAVAAGTGAILLGLHAAVRELKSVAVGLGSGIPGSTPKVPAKPRLPPLELPKSDDAAAAGPGGALFSRDPPVLEHPNSAAVEATGSPPGDAPWQDEAAARERARQRTSAEVAPQPEDPATKPRRNLLFSSSSRKERERAAKLSDSAGAESASTAAAPPVAEPPPRTFEEAWPETERPRNEPAARRSRPSPSTGEAPVAAAAPERPAASPGTETAPQVTVLKSGVVDGMAYSLYSDGSIEAQMPEGMMRFASIEELRSHLDQRP